jgi:sugar phosphate isomerase/epimerase
MKIGMTSYAYRWALKEECEHNSTLQVIINILEKASVLGLEVLQICENVDLEMSYEDYEILRKAADDVGMALELGFAGMDRAIIQKHIKIADFLGAHLIRGYPVVRESKKRLIGKIKHFLPSLKDRGLVIALENSSRCLYSSSQLKEIFKSVNDESFGACIDVANSLGILEKPFETVNTLSPYAVSIHLKDFVFRRNTFGGFTIMGVPLGKGMLDIKGVLNAIEKTGRTPNILLEQWIGRRKKVKETIKEEDRCVKESLEHLNSIIQTKRH